MASAYEKRIQSILKNNVTPLLKDRGFIRERSRYYHHLSELTWLVEVERSGFNDATEAKFTVDCGIYVPGLISRYAPVEEPTRPDYSECALSARLGSLAVDHLDEWWKLSIVDDEAEVDAEIGKDVVERLERDGLPFLQHFQTRLDVLNFLLEPRKECTKQVMPQSRSLVLVYASILCLLLGDWERSRAIWNEAVQTAGKGPMASSLPIIERRIFGDEERL